MSQRRRLQPVLRRSSRALVVGLVLLHLVPAVDGGSLNAKETLAFAADMAERGNWREARYRWERLLDAETESASLYNNLAVAAEATGDMQRALEYYDRALELSEGDPRILDNRRRAAHLQRQLIERAGEGGAEGANLEPERTWTAGDKRKEKGGKPLRVQVEVPIPPRLKLEGMETVLVASFLTEQDVLLDVNRELVRYLRGEFRKQTELQVLDVVPPPAIPEQRPEDLVRNDEFWKYLSREHGADLIVSGIVTYGRHDISGFQEVDVVSARTGQKVRQTKFVEQEEFAYTLDVFFFDGATGTLLHRDRMRRNVIFRGLMNDPIHAFYELTESIGADVLSAVATRLRTENRTIFRR